uniref:Uncharacterized protein n=1 Tax=Aegilops tauschii subsp. strangulata TaxID=200361 RepID=A0A453RCJ5_AEGTS
MLVTPTHSSPPLKKRFFFRAKLKKEIEDLFAPSPTVKFERANPTVTHKKHTTIHPQSHLFPNTCSAPTILSESPS